MVTTLLWHSMDVFKLIAFIKADLAENGYSDLAEEIDDRIKYSSTHTEILMSVGVYLKSLENLNGKAYKIVKVNLGYFLEYLHSVGIHLR